MSEEIRVLHVFGRLDSGGAESRTMDIYRQIDRNNVQFDFVIHTTDKCYFTDEIISLGGRVYNLPRFNGKNYLKYKREWNIFFKKHPEYKIVHGHQTNTCFIYLKQAKKNGLSIRIAHSRNSNKENLIKKYVCKLSRIYATHLFAVSKIAGISEFGKKAVYEGTVKILPNAIKAKKYIYDTKIRISKRNKLNINNKFVVGHIGRFHPQKNHIFVLKIFKEILKINKNSFLILIGDGPLKNEIEKKIKELGIKDSVLLTGIRSDVPELLQAMDVLLFPSLFEGLPGVVLESQASGLPSIISDNITKEVKITDLVEYVSLKNDAIYWANKTLKYNNNDMRKSMINEIKEAGYDVESVSKWYENFYTREFKKNIR